MSLYLDAAPVIYLIEEAPGFGEAVAERLAAKGLELIASGPDPPGVPSEADARR